MKNHLLDLQKVLGEHGVLISFCGRFSQEIIEELGDAVKRYLETETLSKNDVYNVFSVFIEQTQNIKNYSAELSGSPLGERIANSGIVAIGKMGSGYFVSSGNLVAQQDVPLLRAKLEEIVLQDKVGLKKLYKEQLKREIPQDAKGAGLGLIEMARKASAPLEYSLVEIDDDVCFFTLKALV